MSIAKSFEPAGPDDVDILLTADEAYPAFEECLLNARRSMIGGFRIFDPATRLRSPRAKAVGRTWGDLILDALRRGVRVSVSVTDFDAIGATPEHQGTWRSMRRFAILRELAGPHAELLDIVPSLHPARLGPAARLFFLPVVMSRLQRRCRSLNRLHPDERRMSLDELPGLRPWIVVREDGTVRPRWNTVPRLAPATHHHKLAVFDDEITYIGGLDLDERRFDTPDHARPAEWTWHDVQLLVRDPGLARAAGDHLRGFLAESSTSREIAPRPPVLRTLSRKRPSSLWAVAPQPVLAELAEAHLDWIPRAERLIYLETQFLRDRRIVGALCRAARDNPDLTLIAMLPAAPEDVAFDSNRDMAARYGEHLQAHCVRKLRRAFGDRVFVGSPAQRRRGSGNDGRAELGGAPIVYIHAKVTIFDETAAIVSSANLNGRSMVWDTEAGLLFDRPDIVEALRTRCFTHWLPDDAGPDFFALDRAMPAWKDLAQRNTRKVPEAREGFLLPYARGPAARFGTDVPVIPDEMV